MGTVHVLQLLVCFSRNMRGRSRAPFLPLAKVKNGYAWLTLSGCTEYIQFVSVQVFSHALALGDILPYVRSTYSAPIAHAIHAQLPFAPAKPRPNLPLFYNQPGYSPRCLPWLVFQCHFHNSWRGPERTPCAAGFRHCPKTE